MYDILQLNEMLVTELKEIAQSLSDVSIIEQAPMMEGRTMLVVLGPAKAKPVAAKKPEKASEDTE